MNESKKSEFSSRLNAFLSRERSSEPGTLYDDYHALRYKYAVNCCLQLNSNKSAQILDVGRSNLSYMLLDKYQSVSTLGFPISPSNTAQNRIGIEQHIIYNLNDAQNAIPINSDKSFDIIIMAEVLEHLYTSPELTLFSLKQILRPGGFLIVQTPNAAALHKRFKLLAGSNPYETIRVDNQNPGHFREYTKHELVDIATNMGFALFKHEYRDYFSISGSKSRIFGLNMLRLISLFVPSFSRGQTLILTHQ